MSEFSLVDLPGIRTRGHRVDVPLDWADPEGVTISVFARELVAHDHVHDEQPWLVFLQGGPGGKGPRPIGDEGWIRLALQRYRLLLVDQRGTGRSGRVTGSVISAIEDPAQAAGFLLHFLADSIVRDLEALREHLGIRRWSTLGQSYGGFLTLRYLSSAPAALEHCFITGGLASLHPEALALYARTYPRVLDKNRQFAARFPDDVRRADAIADLLASHDVRLPDGDRLSVRRFQSLGIDLGMQHGAERLHWLLEEAFEGDGGAVDALSDTFLDQVMQRTSYWDNPLYMVLQESIYGSGPAATNWAAERELRRHPEFAADARPLLFTGEMMYPWMHTETASLRPFAAATEALAHVTDYPQLYDLDTLAANEVPVDAAVYVNDIFVDADLSMQTAAEVGNVRTWVSDEFEHDGLRESTTVLQSLFDLRDDGGRRSVG